MGKKRNRKAARRPLSRLATVESLESRIALHAGGVIAGHVFLDGNGDADRDGSEFGIPGVVVTLSGSESTGADVDRTIMTDDDGFYSFEELNPGTYRLSQRQSPALVDGEESTDASGAAVANDRINNIVLSDDQTFMDNDFGELGLRAEFINIRMFFASSPPAQRVLRDVNAVAEELAGNASLADSIRQGGEDVPDDVGGDDDHSGDDGGDDGGTDNGGDDGGDDGGSDDGSVEPFAAVTTGSFEDANLLGIRTDLQAGAPPITSDHLTTAINYDGFSNPPTYGPHHTQLLDGQNNNITPRPTGVYSTEQPDEDLLHNLEHGHVWISYNPSLLSTADRTALEELITAGGSEGVIVTPRARNTSAIALASWARLLTLDNFDATQVRNFIETNRGHAPEGFIPSSQKTAASETLDDQLPHTAF